MSGRRIMLAGAAGCLAVILAFMLAGWLLAAVMFGQGFTLGVVVVSLAVIVERGRSAR